MMVIAGRSTLELSYFYSLLVQISQERIVLNEKTRHCPFVLFSILAGCIVFAQNLMLGIPMKIAKIENSKRTAAGLFPLPIVPRALSSFPLPSLPTTQRGLSCGESPS